MYSNGKKVLFNPAYSGIILTSIMEHYKTKYNQAYSVSNIYFILPMFYHKYLLDSLPKSMNSSVYKWLKEFNYVFSDYGIRIREFVDVTNETIKFLIGNGVITIESNGNFTILDNDVIKKYTDKDIELTQNIKKFRFINKWFFEDEIENIYYLMGVTV